MDDLAAIVRACPGRSTIRKLNSSIPNDRWRAHDTRPACRAYNDMMQVGCCIHPPESAVHPLCRRMTMGRQNVRGQRFFTKAISSLWL